MIKIKQPKALIGDRIKVANYRRKPKGYDAVWEYGTISRAEYYLNADKTGWWHYTVILERKTPSKIDYFGKEKGQNTVWVYVRDDKIKKIKD